MGRLFRECLSGEHEVRVYSQHERMDFSSLRELYSWAEIIVLASSLSILPHQLKELSTLSKELGGTKVIFDIATFKADIVGLYRHFPREVKVASVHPMFGPGTASLRGRRFIVVPVPGREEDSKVVGELIKSLGGKVEFLEARTHDRIMGFVIGVPYFLGLSYLALSIERGLGRFGGTSHAFLETYGKAVLNDSPDFVEEVLKRSRGEIEEFLQFLREGKPNPSKLRKRLSEEEIKKAYERFYRALE